MKVKVKVTDVTDYERDNVELEALASHEGDASAYVLLAEEIKSKEEKGEWPGLPFTTTLEVGDSDDDVSNWDDFDLGAYLATEHMDEIAEAYANACCKFDLIKPLQVGFEIITDDE